MNRISKILIAAAIVASAVSTASAQSFSGGWGTGNVLTSHYAIDGRLVAGGAQSTRAPVRDQGLSAFASVPAPRVNTLATPSGSSGYNGLLATH